MANLREIQEGLQAYVLEKDLVIQSEIVKPTNMEVERRLHIYRNAYYIRLVEVLEEDFGVLKKIVGEKAFDAMMRAYLDAYPSHHFSVRSVGRHVAKFLKNTPGCDPSYAELAEFEWALNKVLFAKDAASLTMQKLAEIPPEQWSQMHLVLHPSVQTLRCLYNTSERWQSVNENGVDIPAILEEQPLHHLIWQQDYEPYFYIITLEQYSLIKAIEQGVSFESLCEMMLEHFTEENVVPWVAGTLQEWVQEGIFSDVILA